MCGIVGFVGTVSGTERVLEGLERLEYRGYDSAGIATLSSEGVTCVKVVGALKELRAQLGHEPCAGTVLIGHTRWATHGMPTRENAHPHVTASSAVVHNGIIENHRDLRQMLENKGSHFLSQTDSEVVVHLFDQAWEETHDLHRSIQSVLHQLKGAFSCALISHHVPNTIVALRRHSPLCVARTPDGYMVASDFLATAGYATHGAHLPEHSYALVTPEGVSLYSAQGEPLVLKSEPLSLSVEEGSKKGYAHHMLKEMYEQKRVMYDTVRSVAAQREDFWNALGRSPAQLAVVEQIVLFACGTSYHAAQLGAIYFQEIAQVEATAQLASEFRYAPVFVRTHDWYIALSQSGETADTLEALRMMRTRERPTAVLTNVGTSAMVREADGYILTRAGYEVAVASTKAFTAQVVVLYWLAHQVARERGRKVIPQDRVEQDIQISGEMLEAHMEKYRSLIQEQVAPFLAQHDCCIFLGRGISYPLAREAALKLKEISYLFVDAYPAGELKHGALAVVDENVPVVMFSTADEAVYPKIVSAAQEVTARGATLIVFALEDQTELISLARYAFTFPRVAPLLLPVVMVGVAQLLAYEVAAYLGRPIDRPRNLAKSISVE